MNALVDYGTSSSSSSSESENESDTEKKIDLPQSAKLPKPKLESTQLTTVTNSVFVNPFVQAELAKSALLEKHVKMVPTKEQTSTINGKKICWNYRKGRCRFGHNCKYAHDSDIQKTAQELEAEKQSHNTVVCEMQGSTSMQLPPTVNAPRDEDPWESSSKPRLKRPGLSQSIVPSKKVIKMYEQQKAKAWKK